MFVGRKEDAQEEGAISGGWEDGQRLRETGRDGLEEGGLLGRQEGVLQTQEGEGHGPRGGLCPGSGHRLTGTQQPHHLPRARDKAASRKLRWDQQEGGRRARVRTTGVMAPRAERNPGTREARQEKGWSPMGVSLLRGWFSSSITPCSGPGQPQMLQDPRKVEPRRMDRTRNPEGLLL